MTSITQWPPRKPRRTDWSPADTQYLRDMVGSTPVASIAATLGRTPGAVYAHACRHGIRTATRAARHHHAWTSGDIGRLRSLARTHTRAEAAALLGRTERSIAWQAGVQRISFLRYGERSNLARHSTAIVQRIARMEMQGHDPRTIAAAAGVPLDYVYRIASRARRWRETTEITP